ncbi:glycogen/starch/alpha-glucan phosphorylases family protein [Tritrichomonas foetus]|uniref:Alpha-1,4 glucan phosphorylase n=1 Tax=Tritrichomonas foetus TaxID=1144522 RepID=A0A1J4KD12_9EUKA|nr:glycogen/starch/alpha-glucan phosphorylases family protein [Tritrichomonas foetus]|eukprot:OHT07542.1 glycogen/starch/alpha-glucan phosphorylases family protein [Tritrichomonas foetus]
MKQAPRPNRNVVRPFLGQSETTAPSPSLKQKTIGSLARNVHQTEGSDHDHARHALLWKLMADYIPAEKGSVQTSIVNHIEYTIARSRFNFDTFSAYLACSYSVRDRLIELFNDTMEYFISSKAKQVYYMSIEFLMGRFLRNALMNLELEDLYRDSLQDLDIPIDQLFEEEYDPGLGNGGLGRLAACFMDSLATLNLPAWGYGLMYNYGMFKQTIGEDGSQIEIPDYWLNYGDPWRVKKDTVFYNVGFYGTSENGQWKPSMTIMAVANDFLIPGYATDNTLALRLWSSKPTSELDEDKFRGGDYYDAITLKQRCENLTSVLYPNDNTPEGKEMRLMQEYFMSSASLQDIIHRLKTQQKLNIHELPNMAAIQLNDTHPAIMVAELMRILLDDECLSFDDAFSITTRVFSYTCHTLMPEALEKWPVPLFEKLLPRHIQIIYQINQSFLDSVRYQFNASGEVMSHISIIEESEPKQVRMANLAVVGSHHVNGVAAIHSDLMKKYVFTDFAALWPEKFCNKTNGVTVRRWLHHCNPGLSGLINEAVGAEDWALHTEKLTAVMDKINDSNFFLKWLSVKQSNKTVLANYIYDQLGIKLNPELQLFDIQVKRIHEYKRQTLNIFNVIHRYLTILEASETEQAEMTPRAIIFGGKAAPGYYAAKKLIKLINNVARVVNNDTSVGDLLKVVFVPNYNVTIAEMIIPAADINEQISTAGTEASGTSNMKFAFNSSLIIGTWDGANIEIGDAIGNENVFFFGAKADQVDELKATSHNRPINPQLKRVFQCIRAGLFGDPSEYECLIYPIENGDNYLVNYDFPLYVEAQKKVDQAYKDHNKWVKMCMTSTANMGRFSSDRTISEYAKEIWNIKEYPLPFNPTEGNFAPQTATPGPGSIGSLRRHQQAAMGQVETSQLAVPTKGSFGSLSRRNNPIPPQSMKKPAVVEDDDEDDINIDL